MRKKFCFHLDSCLKQTIFHSSTSHSLRVLTRPLADVSAPKHTAIWPAFIFEFAGFFMQNNKM